MTMQVTDVVQDSQGYYYVAEKGEYDRIQKFSPEGDFILQWGGHGTEPGQMPGTPAILATTYGRGRVLLFGPNPALGAGDVARPELLDAAVRWVARAGPVDQGLVFADVFGQP